MSADVYDRKVRAALLVLTSLALIALFAELIASHAPLLYRADEQWIALPGVTSPARIRGKTNAEIDAARDPGSPVIWSLVVATHDPHTAVPLHEATASDHFARWAHGTRAVLLGGAVVTFLSLALGLTLGGLASAGPSFFEATLRRLVEVTGAAPTLLLVAIFQSTGSVPAWAATALALSATRSVEIARILWVRSQQVKGEDFVLAAHAVGVPAAKLFRTHLVPHVLPAALASAAFATAAAVSVEAALVFLGLGARGAHASWGSWLGQAAGEGDWAVALWPAGSVAVVTGALYVLAERADDQLAAGARPRVIGRFAHSD